MKSRLIFAILTMGFTSIVFLSCNTTSQKVVRKDILTIKSFAVDKLGNYYEIDQLNRIRKINRENKLLFTYSNISYGAIGMIDVSNPHKILVFYFDQQVLLILDNTLSELSKIELNPSSLMTAAGMSNDGNIWLFDSDKRKLIKIDKSGNKIDESFSINEINPDSISDHKIIESDNYVIIPVGNNKIYLFTNQGYFIKRITMGEFNNPVIFDNKIYFLDKKNNSYSNYDIKYNIKNLLLDFSSINKKPDQVILENNKFYILQNNKITVIPLRNEQHY